MFFLSTSDNTPLPHHQAIDRHRHDHQSIGPHHHLTCVDRRVRISALHQREQVILLNSSELKRIPIFLGVQGSYTFFLQIQETTTENRFSQQQTMATTTSEKDKYNHCTYLTYECMSMCARAAGTAADVVKTIAAGHTPAIHKIDRTKLARQTKKHLIAVFCQLPPRLRYRRLLKPTN